MRRAGGARREQIGGGGCPMASAQIEGIPHDSAETLPKEGSFTFSILPLLSLEENKWIQGLFGNQHRTARFFVNHPVHRFYEKLADSRGVASSIA